MLEVEMFAEGVVKQIKDYLPEKYKKMECEVCLLYTSPSPRDA